MIEKFKKIFNNIIDQLIVMGECCQQPPFLNNYLRTIPDLPSYTSSNLLIDSWEKEMVKSGSDSKLKQLEGESVLPTNTISDKILASK